MVVVLATLEHVCPLPCADDEMKVLSTRPTTARQTEQTNEMEHHVVAAPPMWHVFDAIGLPYTTC